MIVDNIEVLPITSIVVVDSSEGMDALTQHVKTQNFVVCQLYNHTIRSY